MSRNATTRCRTSQYCHIQTAVASNQGAISSLQLSLWAGESHSAHPPSPTRSLQVAGQRLHSHTAYTSICCSITNDKASAGGDTVTHSKWSRYKKPRLHSYAKILPSAPPLLSRCCTLLPSDTVLYRVGLTVSAG